MMLLIWFGTGILAAILCNYIYFCDLYCVKWADLFIMLLISIVCIALGPITLLIAIILLIPMLLDNRDRDTCWIDQCVWKRRK